jgi:hypothetical protein
MNRRKLASAAIAALFVSASALPAFAQSADTPRTTSHSVHCQRSADGAIDATPTGPKGGVTNVARARNADGTTDKVATTIRP